MIVPVIILAVGLYYLLAPTGLVGSIWGVTSAMSCWRRPMSSSPCAPR